MIYKYGYFFYCRDLSEAYDKIAEELSFDNSGTISSFVLQLYAFVNDFVLDDRKEPQPIKITTITEPKAGKKDKLT